MVGYPSDSLASCISECATGFTFRRFFFTARVQ